MLMSYGILSYKIMHNELLTLQILTLIRFMFLNVFVCFSNGVMLAAFLCPVNTVDGGVHILFYLSLMLYYMFSEVATVVPKL